MPSKSIYCVITLCETKTISGFRAPACSFRFHPKSEEKNQFAGKLTLNFIRSARETKGAHQTIEFPGENFSLPRFVALITEEDGKVEGWKDVIRPRKFHMETISTSFAFPTLPHHVAATPRRLFC
jgi:hypothetical protein